MSFSTKVTHNGLTGSKAARDSSSRLSALVVYLLVCRQQNRPATKKGFVEFTYNSPLKKMPDDLFRLALRTGVIVETNQTVENRQKTYALGPNATSVVVPEFYYRYWTHNGRGQK